jgi:hypothetical protein
MGQRQRQRLSWPNSEAGGPNVASHATGGNILSEQNCPHFLPLFTLFIVVSSQWR